MRHRPTQPCATIPEDLDPARHLADPQRLAAIPTLAAAVRHTLDELASVACAVLQGDRGHIALLHADHLEAAQDGTDHPVAISAFVIALGEPLMLGDLRDEPRAAASPSLGHGFLAYAGTSLRVDGERVGVLAVLARRPRAWTIGDAERLDTLAEVGGHLLTLP